MTRLRSLMLAAGAVALTAACAGAPKPEAQMASSEGAIRGASEAAQNVPQATLYIKLAQEQRQQALALIKDGDNGRAHYLLARSEADAELALALAKQARAQQEAQRADQRVQELQDKVQP
jgi:Zn-dependent M28 family amino/carboxypeptidase